MKGIICGWILAYCVGFVGLVWANGSSDIGYENLKQGNYTEAFKHLSKAAEQGDGKAQRNLGRMYVFGLGVTQDYTQAFYWFRKAADQGYAMAQFELGLMYDDGQGVTKDYKLAIYWFRKAAEQGDANAQHKLGNMYVLGVGVPQNDKLAYAWISVAVANNVRTQTAPKLRDILASKLDKTSLAEAQSLADKFFDEYQP